MKTSHVVIIGIIIVVTISMISISLAYNQEIKLIVGMQTDEKPSIDKLELSDPICFVVDRTRSDNIGSGVTMDACFTLKQFEEMGCSKPMLEHLLKYSSLLDEELDGIWYLNDVGLPSGISIEDFDKCVDVILDKRPILNSKSPDALEIIKDHPLVDEFYAKYPNTREEVRSDHISYFVGSDDGFKVRMNLYFDENNELDYINLKCYLDRELQTDVPGSFISKYLKDFTCDENG